MRQRISRAVIHSIAHDGWAEALLSTFDTSVIVWLACYVGISFIFRDRSDSHPQQRSRRWTSRPRHHCPARWRIELVWCYRAGTLHHHMHEPVVDAATWGHHSARDLFSMLWSPLLFAFLSKPILDIDAALTAWLKGTPRIGNMVRFADNSGYLVIFPGCSSFGNVSLALLTSVVISQSVGHRWSMRDIFWCLLACAAVIAVNVSRLSIMATDMNQFAAVHNQWGNAIANVIILILIVSDQRL